MSEIATGQKGVLYLFHTGFTWQYVFLRRVNKEPMTYEEIAKKMEEVTPNGWSPPSDWKPLVPRGNCILVKATGEEPPITQLFGFQSKGVFVPEGVDPTEVFKDIEREFKEGEYNFELVEKPLF